MNPKEAASELLSDYVNEWDGGKRYMVADKLSFRSKTLVLLGGVAALVKVCDDGARKHIDNAMNIISDIIDTYESFDYFNAKNQDWFNPDLNVRDDYISGFVRSLERIIGEIKSE